MQPARLDLRITRGMTWRKPFKIMQSDYAYKPIISINQTAPITFTVDHGLPIDNWPVWIEGSTSIDLNSDKTRQRFRMARAIDAQTVELNGVNGHNIKASGGFLVYQLPVDFTGCSASMVFSSAKEEIELTAGNGLDLGDGFINAALTTDQVSALGDHGHYTLTVTHSNGDKIKWLCGEVSIHGCQNNRSC